MPDLERIRRYEALLDRAGPAVEKLLAALRDYAEAKPLVEALREYYRSDWQEDAAMDEAGLLPLDLKRGVLSQDAVFDLLAGDQAIRETVSRLFF